MIAFALAVGLGLTAGAYAQCGPGAGDCCSANGTPGCEDVGCCSCICGCDPFCCNDFWDFDCANMGFVGSCGASNPDGPCAAECSACQGPPPVECPDCAADLNNSGSVGVPDLLALLSCWGPVGEGCECADQNASGSVGVPDLLALLSAWGPCPEPTLCGPGAGDCCTGNPFPSPGCEDADCCGCICACDPYCCNTSWDGLCAGSGIGGCGASNPGGLCVNECSSCVPVCGDGVCHPLEDCNSCPEDCGDCPPLCGPGAGNCCASNGSPGCEDEACCGCICACDPFCCNTTWDGLCGGGGLGGCGASNPDGPCVNECSMCQPECGNGICQVGQNCVNCPEDCGDCPAVCGEGNGDCCSPNVGSPGCDNHDCCGCICGCDPFCCNTNWDGLCAGGGTCGASNPNGQCADECFECVPVCGDGVCHPLESCNTCPEDCGDCPPTCGPGAGDCCSSNGSPGCEDEGCCECICACDAFCCGTTWDALCAGGGLGGTGCGASNPDGPCSFECDFCVPECGDGICHPLEDCNSCPEDCGDCPELCGPGAGDCCSANGSPGCEDEGCCDCICGCDPFCCNTTWDGLCAGGGLGGCGASNPDGPCATPCFMCSGGGNPECGEGAGDCCSANGTPGCEDIGCCSCICGCDPFCCNSFWDDACAGMGEPPGSCGASNPNGPCVNQCMACQPTCDCTEVTKTPGCPENEVCEACVCAQDEFCCEDFGAWDEICVSEVTTTCIEACCP